MAVLKRKTNNGWESVALPVMDQTPTEGSNRGVTSDGIYKAIAASGAVWGGITGTLSNQTDLQSALDAKQATLTAGTNVSITDNVISATDTTYEPATTSANGLMSSADKTKLDGIEAEATKVTPNPATTTAELTGVTIGGTNYKISGVPDGTAASQGLVWDGTQWVKQAGYAYGTSGSQVTITWDGDTTGKTQLGDTFFLISSTPVPSASLVGSTVKIDGTSTEYQVTNTEDMSEDFSLPAGSVMYAYPTEVSVAYITCYTAGEGISVGTYLYKEGSGYISEVKYTSAGELHTFDPQLLPLDSTPTSESANGVTSGGVYTALNDKEDIEFNAAPTALTEALTNIVVGGKTYTSGGALPAGTAASQGLVWNGTEWQKQTGYGYVTEGSGQFDVSWDGDPTGKVVAMTNYVKVSDTLPTVQAGDTATCYMLDGNGGTYGPFTANVSVPSSSEDMLMIQWTLDTMTFQNYIVLRDTTLYEENISKGVYYFYHDGSGSSKYWCSRMVCAGSSSVTHQFDANLIPNKGAAFVTEAPTAANTDGIRVAYLTSEPATKYDGWLYLIKE